MKSIRFDTRQVQATLKGLMTEIRTPIKFAIRGQNGVFLNSRYSEIKPPYQPGDILYVKETWAYSPNWYYIYKADATETEKDLWNGKIIWRPSIHMPREAARIFLRVTEVRADSVCSSKGCGWDVNTGVFVTKYERVEGKVRK